uniref:Uncharacterized protein n=1 Tax=Panagrolaimus sp. ES5 TaxID=591445 RepID=A0AC34G1X1_9BILA
MSLGAPKTEDEIYNEARSQLAKIMMLQEHTASHIERQSKEVSEYPIGQLARQAGFPNTTLFLIEWFDDLIEFDGTNFRAYSSLYDTPELQHIISLQERTKMKVRRGGGGGGRRGRGGGGRGGGRGGFSNRQPPPLNHRLPPPPVRGPIPQRRPQSPPAHGFTVRRPISPDRSRREPSPRRMPYNDLRRSPDRGPRRQPPPEHYIPPPYRQDRGISPSQSERSYTSATTAEAQPFVYQQQRPVQPPPMNRGRSPRRDFVERSELNRAAAPAPPPGFSNRQPYIEVNAARYDVVASTRTISNYEFGDDDDEEDPFAVNTARTLNEEYVNVPSYHQNEYIDNPRNEPYQQPPRQEPHRHEFYDDEFEPDFYIPERVTPPPPPTQFGERRRQQTPPRRVDDREAEYGRNYQNSNEEEQYNPPNGYGRYDHHQVNGVLRERNTNRTPIPTDYYDPAPEGYNGQETYEDPATTYEDEIELQPCRTFNDAQMPLRESSISCNDSHKISAGINQSIFIEDLQNRITYSRNYLDYFVDVITDVRNLKFFNFI